jgi:hypothetical protein
MKEKKLLKIQSLPKVLRTKNPFAGAPAEHPAWTVIKLSESEFTGQISRDSFSLYHKLGPAREEDKNNNVHLRHFNPFEIYHSWHSICPIHSSINVSGMNQSRTLIPFYMYWPGISIIRLHIRKLFFSGNGVFPLQVFLWWCNHFLMLGDLSMCLEIHAKTQTGTDRNDESLSKERLAKTKKNQRNCHPARCEV